MSKFSTDNISNSEVWGFSFSKPAILALSAEREKVEGLSDTSFTAILQPEAKGAEPLTIAFETGTDKFVGKVGDTTVDILPTGPMDQFIFNGKSISLNDLSSMMGKWDLEKFREDPASVSEVQQIFYGFAAHSMTMQPSDLNLRLSLCKPACVAGAVALGTLLGGAAMLGCTSICAAGTVVTIGTLAVPCTAIIGLCTTAGWSLGYNTCYDFLTDYC